MVAEPTETIRLKLSSLSNALIGEQPETIVQIEDNDVASVKIYLPLVIK